MYFFYLADWQVIPDEDAFSTFQSALNPRGEREKDLLDTLDLVRESANESGFVP